MRYRIALGADHRGFHLKQQVLEKNLFGTVQVEWIDVGTNSTERTDYPVYTHRVVQHILDQKVDLGILICGSGIGVSIAANRFKRIYAGLVWNAEIAQVAKEDDNINILVIPADYLSFEHMVECITRWLTSSFKEGRYLSRLKMNDQFGEEDLTQK